MGKVINNGTTECCDRCGSEVENGSIICSNCGNNLTHTSYINPS